MTEHDRRLYAADKKNPGDLLLVDSLTLQSAQEGYQRKNCAVSLVGHLVACPRVNGPMHAVDARPTWRVDQAINAGFLKRSEEPPR